MLSQHLETARLALRAWRQQSTEKTALDAIPSLREATPTVSFSTRRSANANAKLQDFIDMRPDAREVRKALAVKLVYQGYLYDEIQTILDVSRG